MTTHQGWRHFKLPAKKKKLCTHLRHVEIQTMWDCITKDEVTLVVPHATLNIRHLRFWSDPAMRRFKSWPRKVEPCDLR
jgi:hypothetical protein